MEELQTFLNAYGYGALFLLGVAEFAALPVATVPVLLAAGALARGGTLSMGGVILAVSAGGLLADAIWLHLARWRGHAIVDTACGLSANPRVCVLSVRERIARTGLAYLIVGKFIPGTAAMLAAAAGLAGVSVRKFLLVDALALGLWAGTYTLFGWLFADELEQVLDWAANHGRLVVATVLVGAVAAMLARRWKMRSHSRRHPPTKPTASLP